REDFICQDLSTIASRSDVIPPESDHSHSVVISDTYCSPFFDSSSSSDSDATGSTLYSEIDEGELVVFLLPTTTLTPMVPLAYVDRILTSCVVYDKKRRMLYVGDINGILTVYAC
ncbi:hypothetical protein ADUPG1_009843, partial [Aduncisulcus paluster]